MTHRPHEQRAYDELTIAEKKQIWDQLSAWTHFYSATRSTAMERVRPLSELLRPSHHAYILVSNEQGTFLIEVRNNE